MFRLFRSAAIFLCIVKLFPAPLYAADLYIVPVMFERGSGSVDCAMHIFDNSPWPVMYNWMGIGGLRLNEERQLVRTQFFPNSSIFDALVWEPTGRLIGTKTARNDDLSLYSQDPKTGIFSPLETNIKLKHAIYALKWATIFNGTLISDYQGKVFILRGNTLVNFPLPFKMKNNEFIESIFDLPDHKAVALSTNTGRLLLLDSDHNVSEIETSASEEFTEVQEMAGEEFLYAQSGAYSFTIPLKNENDKLIIGQAHPVPNFTGGWPKYHTAIQKYLVYSIPPGFFSKWLHTESKIYQIEDGSVKALEGFTESEPGFSVLMQDIPSRHIVVITVKDRIYIYDGSHRIEKISKPASEKTDAWPWVQDMAGIGKVLVNYGDNLYELTAHNELKEIPAFKEIVKSNTPFDMVDMTASDVTILFSPHGVFAMDKDGHFTHVRNDDSLDYSSKYVFYAVKKYIPAANAVFFTRRKNYMIFDAQSSIKAPYSMK